MNQLDEKKKHKKKPTCSGCKGDNPGLWCRMCFRRRAGKPRKKPGQKGYPKTLNIESLIREFIKESLNQN